MSVQNDDVGARFDAVSAVQTAQINGGNLTPWPKGRSGNPGGRPKLVRAPSAALAEINDTPGDTLEDAIETFKANRRKAGGLVLADHKAIAMARAEGDVERRTHVAAFEAVTDRLEGKVPQAMNVKSEATLTIEVIDRATQLELLRLARGEPRLLEAEVVEDGEK